MIRSQVVTALPDQRGSIIHNYILYKWSNKRYDSVRTLKYTQCCCLLVVSAAAIEFCFTHVGRRLREWVWKMYRVVVLVGLVEPGYGAVLGGYHRG
jgi:hypothetical protein